LTSSAARWRGSSWTEDVAACDREPEADFELGRDLTDAALDASTKRLVDARELLA
jgi:hypothetical protein